MKVEETNLEGCFLLTPKIFFDNRGCFFESFNEAKFLRKTGVVTSFVQDNISKSDKGVLRGLHFQKGESTQAKLVSVIKGKVQDVCVDLRPDSKTYGKHVSVILDGDKHQQLFIPKGFAHGFLVLEDDTIFNYKCDSFYNPEAEDGIIYNDSVLAIDWLFSSQDIIISSKDEYLKPFSSLKDL